MSKRVAVITGVSKGIGLATAKLFLEQGIAVAGWGRTNVLEESDLYTFVKTDITSEEQVTQAYEATLKAFGQVDILINNAGLGFDALMEDMDSSKWRLMFDTNVNGLFYCSKAVIPAMKKQESGYIFNIASIAAQTGIPTMAGYCGTKFAVKGISQAMYKELRNFGIKVTCIYPGSTHTGFFDNIDSMSVNDQMMRPEDIADTMLHCLDSHPNFHHVDIEVRPLKPKRG